MSKLVLVDKFDNPIGEMDKMEAHQKGLLHRAFSVFIFNSKGELLLQKRAGSKYHSGGLWTNTCCSHPSPGEDVSDAAMKRLLIEMGLVANLNYQFSFQYKSGFENGLIEHELDHVFFGYSNQLPSPNPREVEAWEYVDIDHLYYNISVKPEQYTTWFRICLERFESLLIEKRSA